ncbi:MAG TPA: ABC transporter ATP-binding protein [Stellaceae bacterium]|jgi:ATP-binding cassette subfamily B protein/subfamily B ATP-binding cassette protein MsbA|nr:ABC transporter ATP-binding protein [Stellaceae bacterium]
MIGKFLPYLKGHHWQVAGALAQVFLVVGFELLKPWPLQIVIDYVLGGKTPPKTGITGEVLASPPNLLLLFACIGIVVVNVGGGALTLWHNYTTIRIGQAMVNGLRGDLYGHLQRLSLAYHSRQRVGDLMYRITSDSFAVQTMVMNGLLPILSAVILLGGMLFVLIPIDPLLTALALTIVPVLFVLIAVFNRKIVEVATEVRDLDSRVYSLVQWGMAAIKVVQAFTKEDEEHSRFMGASRASLRATLRLYNWQTLYSGGVNVIIAFGTAIVVYAGARAVMSGTLTIGQLIVFIAYLAQLYAPINQISQSWGLIAGARVGAKRVFEVLDTEPDLKSGTRQFPASGARGDLAWRGVAFRYLPGSPVLNDIDFTVAAGSSVAIVGPTGAGKSTLLGLLPRFFDPDTGTVTIDGVDVRDYALPSLRSQIAMVLQPPLIFPVSVAENIAYGRPGADQAAIENAARLARIHDTIARMPEGYQTMLGEGGVALSEGEKQRVTIARALLRDAAILILDEPTSALDVETEALVMGAIETLMQGRTTLIIAHRLSTVRRCDSIVVLHDGTIAEHGDYSELLRRGGIFADYYRTQFAPQQGAATPLPLAV